MKSPAAGMKVRSVPAKTPGKESGKVTRKKAFDPVRVQILGRFDQPVVDLLQAHVERQGHEGQEVVGDAGDDRERAREQTAVGIEEMQRAERLDDEPVVRQDDLPGEGPDQVRDEEGGDDQEQQQVLPPPPSKRDPVRERIADRNAATVAIAAYSSDRMNCAS